MKTKTGGLLVERVQRELRARVVRMVAAREMDLPKESELAREYGVSLKTVRTALEDLKRERVVRSVPGKGTFVVPEGERQRLTLVCCRGITHPFGAVATQTALDVLRERGMPAVVAVVASGRADWASLGLAPRDLGAVLSVGSGLEQAWTAELRREGVPVIVLGDRLRPMREAPTCIEVLPDSRASSFMATRHLLRAGHRRVLLACWGGDDVAWGRDLVRGYREALEEAGVPFEPSHVLTPPSVKFDVAPATPHYIENLGALQGTVDRMLADPDAPTAVVHNAALQLQAQEMIHSYFHDRFDPASTVALSCLEILEAGYRNGSDAWAVAMPYRDIVSLALDTLAKGGAEAAPVRLFIDKFQVWRRAGGHWRLA
jgi:hypothetical protein